MQSHLILPIAALLVLVLANSVANGVSKDNWQAFATGQSTFGKLFDFQNYKKLFNKTYSSLTEELTRRRLFMTNALGAFISTVRYKHQQQPYYLSVNDMSDKTLHELHKMDNRLLDQLRRVSDSEEIDDNEKSDLAQVLPNDDKDVERELLNYVHTHQGEPSARDVLNVIMSGEIDVSVLDEIASETGIKMDDETARLVRPHNQDKLTCLPKNRETEKRSAKMVASQKQVKFWEVGLPRASDRSKLEEIPRGFFARLKWVFANPYDEPPPESHKPDEVFLDLRSTNCFTAPRSQGKCGACYAFAAVAIFEWLYCMKTGEKLEFSEQYVIDCGEAYVQDLDGCLGGSSTAAANFVRNFGLELRNKYPYRGAAHECPYHNDLDPQSTGHIRFDSSTGLLIHLHAWPAVLESGPLLVAVMIAPHFNQYRGGVHGFGCTKQSFGMHAMVLVGHGRERGEEYWLLRNSYGTEWGEQGYYKLAKRANCVFQNYGLSYGGWQAVRGSDIMKKNERYDESFVRRHHEILEQIAPDQDGQTK